MSFWNPEKIFKYAVLGKYSKLYGYFKLSLITHEAKMFMSCGFNRSIEQKKNIHFYVHTQFTLWWLCLALILPGLVQCISISAFGGIIKMAGFHLGLGTGFVFVYDKSHGCSEMFNFLLVGSKHLCFFCHDVLVRHKGISIQVFQYITYS